MKTNPEFCQPYSPKIWILKSEFWQPSGRKQKLFCKNLHFCTYIISEIVCISKRAVRTELELLFKLHFSSNRLLERLSLSSPIKQVLSTTNRRETTVAMDNDT